MAAVVWGIGDFDPPQFSAKPGLLCGRALSYHISHNTLQSVVWDAAASQAGVKLFMGV